MMRHKALALFALVLACAPPSQLRTSGPIDLAIVTTTDVHGRLRAWDYYANQAEAVRGLSRAATIVDSVRAANPGRVILLDAGDLLQGNPLAYVAAKVSSDRTNPIIAAMNAMQYDAAAIGNHEYNYGIPYLDTAVRQARFPFLSANTYKIDPNGVHAYKPWVIIDRAGVKVGIVGATTPGVAIWDAENIRGRLRFGDIVPAVRQAVQEVRTAGADIVLVTVHSGLNEPASYDTVSTGVPSENVAGRIAAEIPGIDFIVYGHSHKENRGTSIGQTLLVQPKNWATSVNVAHLLVSRHGGVVGNTGDTFVANGYAVIEKRGDLVQAAGHPENAAVIAATDAAHRETVAYVTTPIGTTPERWTADSARLKDTPLIDFILETERKAAGSDLASTAAFSTDLVMGPGPITIAQVAQLYPYDNTLRAVRISGKQLRDYLEFSARYFQTPGSPAAPLETDPQIPGYNFDIVSGVDYVIDVSRPIGSRITRLDYRGAAVRDGDSLTMALNNYRQTGGGGYAMLSGAPVVYDKQQEIRQLLIDEVKQRGTITQADYFTPNWRLVRGAGASPTSVTAQPPFPSGTRFLRIIGTNDFHGALEPRPDANGVRRGGAAYVAAAIDRARKECAPDCETLLLDGGDMFQGTPASNLSYGRPVVDYYNRMGYAAAALGNHEFDWGTDTLRARMRQAKYGILGANVRYTDGRDVKWIRNDTIVTRGRTRIGIIGVSTVSTPTTTRSGNVVGLRFDAPAPIVDSIGAALRKRGADLVVVVAHAGAFCGRDAGCNGEIVDLARKVTTKVDAIVSGHTHSLVNTVVNGIPIVQARSSGRAIDVLDIPLGRAADLASRHEVRELASDTIKPLASIDSIVQRAVGRVAPLVNRHVATIPVTLARQGAQYPLGNLIADAQRWAGKGDVAIMNNGGIRTELRAGDATYGSLFEIQPFGNTLYSLTMTGEKLRGLLEAMLGKSEPDDHVSGLTITYDPSKPKGSRIVSVTMADGTPLSDTRTYNVILNDFLATGGEGYNAAGRATASKALNVVDLDALIDYLQSLPEPIAAPTEVRITPVAR